MSETTATPTGAATTACDGAMNDTEFRAWVGLLRSHAHLVRTLDCELRAAHDLPLTSYEVLLFLQRSQTGELRMSDLTRTLVLTPGGITRLVDRLAESGLVRRRRCSEDARVSYAVITDKGRTRLEEARETHLAGVRSHFLERFDADELAQLAEAFARIAPKHEGC